jgi:histidinol dehydrogenase
VNHTANDAVNGSTSDAANEPMGDAMRALELSVEGRLDGLSPAALSRLFDRDPGDASDVSRTVRRLIADVRDQGDPALVEMAKRFDGVQLTGIEVPWDSWDAAVQALPPEVRQALLRAADNIRRFHAAQVPSELVFDVEPGVRITRAVTPLEKVGVYAPGGTAAYPSSVLMGVVPARAAGVGEVIVCSPPGPDGVPPDEVIAACAIAGADRLFTVGGAGAIAALAFGTETIPAVDGIVGPGNRWVDEAKRQVAGRVVIDCPAGPSEVLVVADDSANATWAAHELLAQAEHDPDAACVLVTTSERTARECREALGRLLAEAPRAEIAREALASAGAILLANSDTDAFDFAQRYAPEHLSIMTAGGVDDARRVRTAGTTFVGGHASVAFGDYLTGANHVLPTNGRSRSFSGLSVQQFLRSYTIQEVTSEGAAAMAEDVATLARSERLPAHAAAALARSAT